MKNTLKPLPSFLSETPRTDEVQHNVAELAMHSRKLERELAELMKDKERLDWLLKYATMVHGCDKPRHVDSRYDIDKEMEATNQ